MRRLGGDDRDDSIRVRERQSLEQPAVYDAEHRRAEADADAELSPEARAVAFHNKPWWQRFLIVLAGPVANFLLAIAIFAAFFASFGMPRTPAVVGQVQPGSVAAAAGLRPGDRIEVIAGQDVESFEDLRRIVSIRPGESVVISIDRSGRKQDVRTTLGAQEITDEFGQSYRIGLLGILGGQRELQQLPVISIVPEATRYTFALTRSMIDGLGQIITGQRSTKDLGGPLKMAQIAGQQASLGAFEFIQLLAFFSINLGFINLLPVPMLDGGHLLFYAIETIRGRPLSERAQEVGFRIGLAVVVMLMIFATFNDILRLATS